MRRHRPRSVPRFPVSPFPFSNSQRTLAPPVDASAWKRTVRRFYELTRTRETAARWVDSLASTDINSMGIAKGRGERGEGESEKRDVYAGICETSESGGGFRGARRRVVVSRLRRRHRANVVEIKSLTLLTDARRECPGAVYLALGKHALFVAFRFR